MYYVPHLGYKLQLVDALTSKTDQIERKTFAKLTKTKQFFGVIIHPTIYYIRIMDLKW